jgi:hypothetical protein
MSTDRFMFFPSLARLRPKMTLMLAPRLMILARGCFVKGIETPISRKAST